jgi:hypothetical protein
MLISTRQYDHWSTTAVACYLTIAVTELAEHRLLATI